MTPERCARLPLTLALAGLSACGGGGDGSPPAQVEGLSAQSEDGAVVLQWAVDHPALSYNVYFAPAPEVDPATAGLLGGVRPPLVHEGLENGVTLHYRVAGLAGVLEGPLSDEVAVTPEVVADPLFKDQWHLFNTGQQSALPGEDANVRDAWGLGFLGQGVRIAVVDDGLEVLHEDLISNVAHGESFDYTDGDADPTTGRHGTSCAGIAAARDGNGLGLRGAAPRAQLVGYNFLENPTLSNEADAMVRGLDVVAVSSNSWGPPDGTGDLGWADFPWRVAVEQGLAEGRGGRGIVYVFAGGNGHQTVVADGFGIMDNSNYDGFATHFGVIAVGAVDHRGLRSVYSERGANLLLCAPSARSGGPPAPNNPKISTTDRTGSEGYNDGGLPIEYADTSYTRNFDGTSASTPIVAGVAALVIQARPELTWRDVRLILATTARRNDDQHADWIENPAGHWVNHDYGFGVVDAAAAVTAALDWTPLPPEVVHTSPRIEPDLPIPDDDPAGVAVVVPVAGSGIQQIEFVEVLFRSDHPFAPELSVVLQSPVDGPAGEFVSILAEPHDTTVEAPQRYQDWPFGTVRHLGQPADGDWTLFVADHAALDEGRVQSVQLVIHGR